MKTATKKRFPNGTHVHVTDGQRKGMNGVVEDGRATGKSADVNIDGMLHRIADEFLIVSGETK